MAVSVRTPRSRRRLRQPPAARAREDRGPWRRASRATVTPGRTRCRPLTMTTSPAARPFVDDAQAVDEPARLDGPVLDDALLVDDEHEPLAEIGADRAIVDERRAVARRAHELHAREQARRELPVGVVEHGARTDRAVVRVDLVVDEVEPSRVRIAFLVDEADVHDAVLGRVRAAARARDTSARRRRSTRRRRRPRRRVVSTDRRVDEIARRHDRARHAAGDRRRHARERQVELRPPRAPR